MPAPDGAASRAAGEAAVPPPPVPGTPGPPRRRRLRRALLVAGVVLLVLLVAAGWLASRAAQAADGLTEAGAVLADLESGLAGGDVGALADGLPGLQEDTARARSAASDPVWRLAEHLPWAGPNLTAVRTVAVAVDDVATDALPAVVELGELVADPQVRRADGSIDLGLFVRAAPALDRAATTTRASAAAVGALDTARLVGRVAGPVTQVSDGLATAADALGSASDAARLLPPMLGADGPRTYLLLSLNSAELRSAGGIVGAVAAFTADGGAIRLVDQRSTRDLRPLDEPVLPLTDEELAVHTDRLGRWVQNTVLTPDFPRSAELVSAMWARAVGTPVDGVLAMDPVAVAYLLDATGPVEAGGVELTADTVLDVLLREAYVRLPVVDEADAFYADVASALFTAVSSGRGDTRALLDALVRASDERRLRVWSAHPAEQDRLSLTSLGADFLARPGDAAYAVELPGAETARTGSGVDTRSPAGAPGVFLNDGSAGKLDFFLTTELTVEELRCAAPPAPGWATAVLRLDLAYDPPGDIAGYPEYVTGTADTGLPVGGLATNVTVYAPPGGRILDQRLDDALVGGLAATEQERAVSTLTTRLLPGGRATYRVTVTVPAPGADESLEVWTTPTLTSPGVVTGTCTD
ncbi:hypothetical protein CCE01nite_37720 [Cellulomonas cellasea]|uniref:DUF4012 domain-containing protein n=1 Tax=Cellulomonas cellasea TaxID=43670 RepID=A0A4Y3L0C4_9CELL|nr:hypothetical protein CCE01nite_37720 [Cellulomonas cellasea]